MFIDCNLASQSTEISLALVQKMTWSAFVQKELRSEVLRAHDVGHEQQFFVDNWDFYETRSHAIEESGFLVYDDSVAGQLWIFIVLLIIDNWVSNLKGSFPDAA